MYSRLRIGANRAMWAGAEYDRSLTGPRILEYWESVGIAADRCFYTGEDLDGHWELDHKVPISRGGTHTIDNLVPCTRRANRSKADLTAEEFEGYLDSA